MSNKYPWGKFWWDAWLNDLGLQSCDMAAQGLWMNIVCLMHKSERVGFLVVQGKAMTAADIAKRVGIRKDRAERLLKVLKDNGVYSVDENGVIYSRRIAREQQARMNDNVDNFVDKSVDNHQGDLRLDDDRTIIDGKTHDYRKQNLGKSTPVEDCSLKKKKEIKFKKEKINKKKNSTTDDLNYLSPQWMQTAMDRLKVATGIHGQKSKELLETWFIEAKQDGEIVMKAIELSHGKEYPVAYISKVVRDLAQRSLKKQSWSADAGKHAQDHAFLALSNVDQLTVLKLEKEKNPDVWWINYTKNHFPSAFNYLENKGLISVRQAA